MKTLVLASSLFLSVSAFSQEAIQAHFDHTSEMKCQSESNSLGCGQAKSDTDAVYLACMEKNAAKVSADCKPILNEMKKRKH